MTVSGQFFYIQSVFSISGLFYSISSPIPSRSVPALYLFPPRAALPAAGSQNTAQFLPRPAPSGRTGHKNHPHIRAAAFACQKRAGHEDQIPGIFSRLIMPSLQYHRLRDSLKAVLKLLRIHNPVKRHCSGSRLAFNFRAENLFALPQRAFYQIIGRHLIPVRGINQNFSASWYSSLSLRKSVIRLPAVSRSLALIKARLASAFLPAFFFTPHVLFPD